MSNKYKGNGPLVNFAKKQASKPGGGLVKRIAIRGLKEYDEAGTDRAREEKGDPPLKAVNPTARIKYK